MKISEISTTELRKLLSSTQKSLGPETIEVKILKRELARRGIKPQSEDKGGARGNG
jgi:hypothetical protein